MHAKPLIAALAALGFCAASHALPVFADNFDADALQLNQTAFLGGWAVAGGSVDLIGAGGSGAAAKSLWILRMPACSGWLMWVAGTPAVLGSGRM